jgi:hypothetical protein
MTSDGEILRACGRRPHRHGGVADSGHAPAIWSECEFTRSLGLVRANTPGRHLDGPLAQHELGQLLRIDRTTMVAVVDL